MSRITLHVEMSSLGQQNDPSATPAMKLTFSTLNCSGISEYVDMAPKQLSEQDPSQAFLNKRGVYGNGKNTSFSCSTPMPAYDDSFCSVSTGYSSENSSMNAFAPIEAPKQKKVAPIAPPRTIRTQIELKALMELQMFENQAYLNERNQNTQNLDIQKPGNEKPTYSPELTDTTLQRKDTTIESSDEGEKNLTRYYTNLDFVNNSTVHISTDSSSADSKETPDSCHQIEPATRAAEYFDPLRCKEEKDEPLVLRYEAERALVYFDPVKLEMPVEPDEVTSKHSSEVVEKGEKTERKDLFPKLIDTPPNLIERQMSQKQQTATSSTEKTEEKPKRARTKPSKNLISFDSASESSEEDLESDQPEENDKIKTDDTEAEIDPTTSEKNAYEAPPSEIPEATGAFLEGDEDEAYDEYDENRVQKKLGHEINSMNSEPSNSSPEELHKKNSSALMQPLASGYVPLDDLWDKPWFDMKATSQTAEQTLMKYKRNGSFMVRNSKDRDGRNFALSFYSKFINGGAVNHLKISFLPESSQWKLGRPEADNSMAIKFNTVSECVNYYIINGFTLDSGMNITLKKTVKEAKKTSIGGSISKTVKKEMKLVKP